MKSTNYLMWQVKLSRGLCKRCLSMAGKVYERARITGPMPPLHPNCRCELVELLALIAGSATLLGENGADWWLVYQGRLPDYYILYQEARANGWQPQKGNLHKVLPGKMIMGGIYRNDNGHLPDAPGRVWYEADIDYAKGYRNLSRIVFSNDGLIFVTYDHYHTFFEVVAVEKTRQNFGKGVGDMDWRDFIDKEDWQQAEAQGFGKTYPEEWYAFKPIKENPIILDFGLCEYPLDIHTMLKEKFGLPEYYGCNWDALWDCLRYLFYDMGMIKTEIYNFRAMPKDWQEYCQPMLNIFARVHNETPNFMFEVVS